MPQRSAGSKAWFRRVLGGLGPQERRGISPSFADDPIAFRDMKLKKFHEKHGFWPDIENPTRFSEKLITRIVLDRDPYYHLYATKRNVQSFLTGRVPEGLRFAKTLKVRASISVSDFTDLPDQFVLKSSFGSGLNYIVRDKQAIDAAKICETFNARLPLIANAQGATDPNNCVIFEEFLGEADGSVPADYKFHCFSQPDQMPSVIAQIDTDRFGEHRQTFVDEDFVPCDLAFGATRSHDALPPPPANFRQMINTARELAAGFDYIRVDLYSTRNGVYFGEFTPFHQGGFGKVSTREWDERLGALWHFRLPSFQPEPDWQPFQPR